MGNVMVALDDEKERLLREMARERHGGKKGALSATVAEGLDALARKNRRLRAMKRQFALMDKGFDFGLKGRKVFEKRSEIYDR